MEEPTGDPGKNQKVRQEGMKPMHKIILVYNVKLRTTVRLWNTPSGYSDEETRSGPSGSDYGRVCYVK